MSGGLVRCRWCLAARSVRVWWCVVVYLVKCPPERLSPACRAWPPWPVRFAVCASSGGFVAGVLQLGRCVRVGAWWSTWSSVHLRACHQLAGLALMACALCRLCFAWWLCGVGPVWWLGPLSLVPCSSVGVCGGAWWSTWSSVHLSGCHQLAGLAPMACAVCRLCFAWWLCRWRLAARSVRVWWCLVVYLVKCLPERLSPACRPCPPWRVRFAAPLVSPMRCVCRAF